jgi:hypothetical protein
MCNATNRSQLIFVKVIDFKDGLFIILKFQMTASVKRCRILQGSADACLKWRLIWHLLVLV